MQKTLFLIFSLLAIHIYADALPDKIKQQNIQVVKAAAKGLSEKLPQKVDKYTSLVKIASEGERLIYTYEINDPRMSDDAIKGKGQKKMKAPVTHGICTSSKRFLQSGISITYRYIGAKSKKELFAFDVSKKDCKSLN